MGKGQSKEDVKEQVIIAQTSSGGDNHGEATLAHMKSNNILLSIICGFIIVGVLIGAYYLYKRCHKQWIQKELRSAALERILSRVSYRRRARDARDRCDDIEPQV